MSQAAKLKTNAVVPALSQQAYQHIKNVISQAKKATKNGNVPYGKAIKIIQETLLVFPHDHSQEIINEVMRRYLLALVEQKKFSGRMPPEYQTFSAEELLTECQRIAKNPNKEGLRRILLPVEVLITGKGNRLIFNGLSKQRKPPTIMRKIGR